MHAAVKRMILRSTADVTQPAVCLFASCLLLGLPSFSQVKTGDGPVPQLARASRAIETGDLSAAERTLTQLLKTSPGNAGALNLLGVVRAQQQRTAEAEGLFRQAIQLDPKLAGPYANLGILYRGRNDAAQAMEMLQKAADLSPQDGRVLYNLALLHGERGEFDTAIGRLKAIPANRRPADHWQVLASLYIAGRNYAQAEEALRRALARDPESISLLRQLAGLALKRNDTEASWKYMVQARRVAPNSPELLYEYAQISLKNQLAAEAIVAMRKAVLLEPDRPEYLLLLGNSLMESPMEFHEALPFLERYVRLKPDDPDGRGALGWAYYTNKDLSRARAEIEESLRLQPDRVIGWYQLGVIEQESGESARALELLGKVVQRQPNHADAHLALGMVYARQGQIQKAREAFEAAARLNPEEPKAHYQLSLVCRRLGDSAAAAREMQLYQETLKRFRERNERSVSMPSTSRAATNPDRKNE